MTSTRYAMKRPCPKCPFRTDVTPYIRGGRAEEIARSVMSGGDFACHQTTVADVDEDGNDTLVDDHRTSRTCAGSMIVQMHEGQPNQMLRISMRLGMFDPDALDMTSPVYPSFTEWVQAVKDAENGGPTDDDMEHCGVVGRDCEDPAGWGIGGGALSNTDEGTCGPDAQVCQACGERMCEACAENAVEEEGGLVCETCAGD